MTSTAAAPLVLGDAFATALPELSVPWQATPFPDARLLVLNEELARELGLDPDWLRSPAGLRLLTGAEVPAGSRPVAQGYAGHQFGGFTPRLGDGRALLLGELTGPDGRVRDLHLKGSGPTPFSRGGDGFAAVGPMLREYVLGEAMHALGVPTTRALAVLATGETVRREQPQSGGLLVRVAASHLRVGTVQYAAASADVALLRRVVDLAVARHHPEAAAADEPPLALLDAVVAAQARLVASWMLVGFVHGVLNTDNVTLSGQTIDYGPCAFLDAHDPAAVFSSIDAEGRYAYGRQPAVTQWNLARLAEALLPLLPGDEKAAVARAVASLDRFVELYRTAWSDGLRAKVGLAGAGEDGVALGRDLLALAAADAVDHTLLFRRLAGASRGDVEPVRSLFLDLAGIDAWLARWRPLSPDAAAMDAVNPAYVPRNHLVEQALTAASGGDLDPVHRLLDAVTRPFAERAGLERYAEPGPRDPGYRTFCGT